ncbi:4'-phosphopantetheinyl transferase [Streptomyces sp. NBC_01563]|uniref:4'-phosphopantetheinyl transferase family protein n=1 Tax=Streptomyces sp. NBC_01563 TaxID=2975880 RepID=UPI003869F257
MIKGILPPTVAVAAVDHDPAGAELFPEEEAAVIHAEGKRYREFATVRWCARRAMAQLKVSPAPIVRGKNGAPAWPAGIVGSMTHCEGYRAAAVASTHNITTLGIDAEVHEAIPKGVLKSIACDEELSCLRTLNSIRPDIHWDRLMFSAKESVYKAWFPITKKWLGFRDAVIVISQDGTFTARLLPSDSPFDQLDGRWAVEEGLVATSVVVPASSAEQSC